ncbi:PRC-barrel domain-containing protein [Sulfitobacter sp. S190]|uniref:PRC-barrel domain-containing protein n=1 Tax=Sulfitobacter sp. S190 TaxID=2867022 RepID=UPI0021A2848C|nr:PRC-barrel domain-containing protein [Sulfitobacter sp. S190]UWR21687.1 PRC-barrel domain-containing protein [Sulfitobacter sp. S190]
MKRLFASTAVIVALSVPAAAQSTSQQTAVGSFTMSPDSLIVGEMIGAPVYNFRGRPMTDTPMPLDGAKRFDRIASIKDLVINSEGAVEAIVMSVGGIWGLADREVAAPMEGVTVVTDVRGDRYYVIFTDEDALDAAPRFNKFDVRDGADDMADDSGDSAFLPDATHVLVAEAKAAVDIVGQDPDALIKKAKPADEMEGDTAPNGTSLDAAENPATVDGRPRDAQFSDVGTEKEEAEVGIPDEPRD